MLKNINKSTAGLIIGVIIIVTTLVIFFFGDTTKPKLLIDVLGLIFILVSEISLFICIYLLNTSKETHDKAFIKSGIITSLFFYWLITTVFYILFRNFYIVNIGGFITINIIILALSTVISIFIYTAYNKARESNMKVSNAVSTMKNLENKVKLLCDNISYIKYKDQLNKLYEDIKYCNNSVLVDSDKRLKEKLLELENKLNKKENKNENLIYVTIEDIRLIIKKRNLEAGEKLQGGI